MDCGRSRGFTRTVGVFRHDVWAQTLHAHFGLHAAPCVGVSEKDGPTRRARSGLGFLGGRTILGLSSIGCFVVMASPPLPAKGYNAGLSKKVIPEL